MPSSFTWLDYSEHERRKMLDAIRLFKDQGTVDELGIGTIRDTFADLFFPGTGTVQTRARYFLLVSWMYLSLERNKISSSLFAARARENEVRLIDVLADSDDSTGTIGVLARKGLKRLPSSIYWQGLGAWGIRRFQGSQDHYHRSIDGFYDSNRRVQFTDDKEPAGSRLPFNWHSALPAVPKEFPRNVSLKLTKLEGEYLRERILASSRHTLLAFLVDQGELAENTDFPWEHHQFNEFPALIRTQLDHARNFSDLFHGAALLYNLMLAQAKKVDEEIDKYSSRLEQWAEDITARHAFLFKWDRAKFWEIVATGNQRVPHLTRAFVDNWIDLALSPMDLFRAGNSQPLRLLVRERERQLKKNLARLSNHRSLELWNGEAGTRPIDYRWRNAQTIVRDILEAVADA
jgi:Family of unknown function (DUF6361)